MDKASDWTFGTKYGGHFEVAGGGAVAVRGSERELDWGELKRRDLRIVWWKELILFEDELDDNGEAVYSVRIVSFGR